MNFLGDMHILDKIATQHLMEADSACTLKVKTDTCLAADQ